MRKMITGARERVIRTKEGGRMRIVRGVRGLLEKGVENAGCACDRLMVRGLE